MKPDLDEMMEDLGYMDDQRKVIEELRSARQVVEAAKRLVWNLTDYNAFFTLKEALEKYDAT